MRKASTACVLPPVVVQVVTTQDEGATMAAQSHSKIGLQQNAGSATAGPPAGPPPSTIAAQLVHNISATARSSRPDENGELKKLFVLIERVKNDPSVLDTPADRVEHNHMLIYVYTRVVLENLRLDDPLADSSYLKTEASKAINFYKLTIKESPGVLAYSPGDGQFLFRGSEPLWVWLLPKLLRLVGHGLFIELAPELEEFFMFLLDAPGSLRSTRSVVPSMLTYLQEIHDCKLILLVL